MNIEDILKSNQALPGFDGLSPNQMNRLLQNPLSEQSFIQFCDNIDNHTLNQIPLFSVAEYLIKILNREKQLKLTPKGALPQKTIAELCDQEHLFDRLIDHPTFKGKNESDYPFLVATKLSIHFGGLAKVTNNNMELTKKAEKLLSPLNRTALFKTFFRGFASKFNWSLFDNYKSITAQFGWAYSIYLLNKFGNQETNIAFYAEKYARAFPMMIQDFKGSDNFKQFMHCYSNRTINQFWQWFGFIAIAPPNINSQNPHNIIVSTTISNKLFIFK